MRALIVAFALIVIRVSAQDDTEVNLFTDDHKDSIRSAYIQSFPDHFFVWPVLKQRKLDFEISDREGSRRTLAYKSNKPYSFGVGMYIFEFGVELAFTIPLNEQSKRIYGESSARDLQLNMLGKQWGVDAYAQRYSGFYIEDYQVRIPSNTPYPQRSDIETLHIGATANYIFNNTKFSFRSVFNFAERQLRSAGSFMIFGSINSFRVQGDSALIGPGYENSFGQQAELYKVRSTILGIAPGYAYSLVYKSFFLSGILAIGPAHNWLAYTLTDSPSQNDLRMTTFTYARLALGYNGERIFGGLSFSNQGRNTRFENIEVTNSNSAFRILIGYRFKEFGILSKKASDIPRQLLN